MLKVQNSNRGDLDVKDTTRSGLAVKNSFVSLFSQTEAYVLWTSNYYIWQQNFYCGWVFSFPPPPFFFFSLHKLFGKNISFYKCNLFLMKSCSFNDSLDIDIFIRLYFPFNKCFDVASIFSVFCVYVSIITPFQLSGRSKAAALHNFHQK